MHLPVLWLLSQCIPLDKHNDKQSCAAFRLIHLLDPLSKDFVAISWNRSPFNYRQNAYGFIVKRRREEAVLVIRVLKWRLRQLKLGSLSCFWDLSNAFPSMAYDQIDDAVDRSAPQHEGWFLKQRYRRCIMIIRGPDGIITAMRALTGDRQGDVAAPLKFVITLDPHIDGFEKKVTSALNEIYMSYIEPCTGFSSTSSTVSFADDIARIGCCLTSSGANELKHQWNNALQEQLTPCQIAQNASKLQVLVEWSGKASKQKACSTHDLCQQTGQRWFENVKHLGLWHEIGMRTVSEVNGRITAAQQAWSGFRRFWIVPQLPRKFLRLIFLASVVSTLLSGLEVCVLNQGQLKKLDTFALLKMRVLMQGEARDHANQWVRQSLRIPSIESVLRVRRLAFVRALLLDPAWHMQLLAILTGSLTDGTQSQLDAEGKPLAFANPWLRQY
jgi:hypothetical protein